MPLRTRASQPNKIPVFAGSDGILLLQDPCVSWERGHLALEIVTRVTRQPAKWTDMGIETASKNLIVAGLGAEIE